MGISCEYYEIVKNSFFYTIPLAAVSDIIMNQFWKTEKT